MYRNGKTNVIFETLSQMLVKYIKSSCVRYGHPLD